MDLEAILARRPQLVLVDELAHTNAPGSRHPKRYQDVIELLDAGHQRLHDPQRPAHREPRRRRPADHRRAGQRDGARFDARAGRRDRAGRPDAGGAARAPARGQGLPGRPRRGGRARISSRTRTSPRCANWPCASPRSGWTSACARCAPGHGRRRSGARGERLLVAVGAEPLVHPARALDAPDGRRPGRGVDGRQRGVRPGPCRRRRSAGWTRIWRWPANWARRCW